MGFQNAVYTEQALGREGFIARNNPVVSLPMIAEGSAVKAGSFAFAGTDAEKQVVGASASTSEATAVAGLVAFDRVQLNQGASSLAINEGEEVRLVLKGYAFVRSTTAAVKGDSVYMDPATGDIKASSSSVSDYIDTGWKVETGAAAGQVCEIYNI
jgi:hypothetical protein